MTSTPEPNEKTPPVLPSSSSELLDDGGNAEARIRQLSRRSFVWAGLATGATLGGLWAFNRNPPEEAPENTPGYVPLSDGAKTPFRRVMQFNEAVAQRLFFRPSHRAQEFARSDAREPRNNYKGETPVIDLETWKLQINGAEGGDKTVTLADLQTLPEVSQTTELKCVEGWSTVVNWSGARFLDFAKKYPPPPGTRYVAMLSEPEGYEEERYYVGLDLASCLHPQTLLAWKMNDQTLTAEHGAPLRLVMPHKYGIKQVKLITTIAYTPKRPDDYWAERGYDYYAGL
jgi:DMSO/TMAO reductase YedYZ molybdopterin-dependent catalytic subunit